MESNAKEEMGEMSKVEVTVPEELRKYTDACVSIRTESRECQTSLFIFTGHFHMRMSLNCNEAASV